MCWWQSFPFFVALREKKEKFEWIAECEETFSKIKVFLKSPPILTRSKENLPFLIYLSVTERATSSVLVQEINKTKKLVYFISKVFKGAKTRYHKIEKLTLAIFTTTIKLWPYFQGHVILVKTNYLIRQVLKKLESAGRMLS